MSAYLVIRIDELLTRVKHNRRVPNYVEPDLGASTKSHHTPHSKDQTSRNMNKPLTKTAVFTPSHWPCCAKSKCQNTSRCVTQRQQATTRVKLAPRASTKNIENSNHLPLLCPRSFLPPPTFILPPSIHRPLPSTAS